MKKIYLIHGWDGSPEEPMHKWIKESLEQKGFEVIVPEMPNAEEPKIKDWVNKLNQVVENVNENVYFIGHSIGSQAILRYLEKLPVKTKIGGIIFIAPWFNLTPETFKDEEVEEIAKPWIETPINLDKIKNLTKNITAIFSDNDPWVPISERKIFKEKLNAKTIIKNKKGHFTEDDGIKEIPIVVKEIMKMLE